MAVALGQTRRSAEAGDAVLASKSSAASSISSAGSVSIPLLTPTASKKSSASTGARDSISSAEPVSIPLLTPPASKKSSTSTGARDSISSAGPADTPLTTPPAPQAQQSLRERLTSTLNKVFSSIASIPGVIAGCVKTVFSYISGLFSRTPVTPAAARDIQGKDSVRLEILANLSKKDEARFAKLAEDNNDQAQLVMGKSFARYNAVMSAKTCAGVKLTDENRQQIAIREAAKIVAARV